MLHTYVAAYKIRLRNVPLLKGAGERSFSLDIMTAVQTNKEIKSSDL